MKGIVRQENTILFRFNAKEIWERKKYILVALCMEMELPGMLKKYL